MGNSVDQLTVDWCNDDEALLKSERNRQWAPNSSGTSAQILTMPWLLENTYATTLTSGGTPMTSAFKRTKIFKYNSAKSWQKSITRATASGAERERHTEHNKHTSKYIQTSNRHQTLILLTTSFAIRCTYVARRGMAKLCHSKYLHTNPHIRNNTSTTLKTLT